MRPDMLGKTRASLILLVAACVIAVTVSGTTATAAVTPPNIVKDEQTDALKLIGAASAAKPIKIDGVRRSSTLTQAALGAAAQYGRSFGITEPSQELAVSRQSARTTGGNTVRLQQFYQGIPVIGGELVVNLNQKRNLISMNGEVSPELDLPVTPSISADKARQTAIALTARLKKYRKSDLRGSQPVLSIYDPRLIGPEKGKPALVWRVEVTAKRTAPVREFVLISASSGKLALRFSMVSGARNRATYNGNLMSYLPGTILCTEVTTNCTAGSILDADKAHKYAADTYDFYYDTHGRDSFDNNGATIKSTVRYREATEDPPTASVPYANAYWDTDGQQMVYGEGYSLADDVVAHEITHAVTEHTSNLFYYYQSGAINESLSDVWGEFVDLSNADGDDGDDSEGVKWLIGEDLPGGAIRDMSDPTSFGDPDKMSSSNYNPDLALADSGGVHANSGINNKAVYLMTDGGTFNGKTVTGLGITKVAKIYYEAQANLLTSGSSYQDLYAALNQACINITGISGITTADCGQVTNALDAVEMNNEPTPFGTSFAPQASYCSTGIQGTPIFSDDMEGDALWQTQTLTTGVPGLDNNWFYWNSYATSGIYALSVDDAGFAADSVAWTATGVNIPTGGAYLHFRHAFDLESVSGYNIDGGVVEYSANGGAWLDAGSLPTVGQDYTGSLWGAMGLDGQDAFGGDSHGFVSTRYSLASLAGKTVRFRFRLGTDIGNTTSYLGWMIDDLKVYVCDSKNPVATMNARSYSTDVSKTATFRADWSATDPAPATGIANYDVWVKDGKNGAFTLWRDQTTSKFSNYYGTANHTYYFKVMARDKVGHEGAFSALDKTIVPADQSVASYSSGWSGVSSSNFYKGSSKYTKKSGASASYSFSGNSVALILTKGTGRGKAKVYVDGNYVKTIDTYASSTRYRQPFAIKSWSTIGSHKVKVVNLATSGRPRFELDGLAIGK